LFHSLDRRVREKTLSQQGPCETLRNNKGIIPERFKELL
jgi:hypothetical protein